jgi:hypothetical protein
VRAAQWLVLAALLALSPAYSVSAELSFDIEHGNESNRFLREGPAAAHLVLRSGREPRVLVAFPAGDSGVALWFEPLEEPARWRLMGSARPLMARDSHGNLLYGIETDVSVDRQELRVRRALLSSIRFIRDFESTGRAPAELLVRPTVTGSRILWARDRLDGHAGYELAIEVLEGGQIRDGQLHSERGPLHLRIRALTGEQPLLPLQGAALLMPQVAGSLITREVLEYLSYREKYLAGSWRFDTYFGRDTLMTLAILEPALTPEGLESGFASVLSRTSAAGEVAHEESIGEFAVLMNARQGITPADRPSYDYSMIDESLLLGPVIARWLLGPKMSREQAARFLQQRSGDGGPMGEHLLTNLLWVVNRTAAFARDPSVGHLVGLEAGTSAGNWRDSPDGLGGGRYPYDVNAVLAPAALQAAHSLWASRLLQHYASAGQARALEAAETQRGIWLTKAREYFAVKVPQAEARSQVIAYAQSVGVDPQPALRSLTDPTVGFEALALTDQGTPIPVMHSDTGFLLLFDDPPAQQLSTLVATTLHPFPAGLWTPVGMLIANPAFAGRTLQQRFGKSAYHGTVIWSWQQALFAAGLQRQLSRRDLPAAVRDALLSAQERLWTSIRRSAQMEASELWSWSFAGGCYRPEPFATATDEANAAQLWSTAFLGLAQPRLRDVAIDAPGCFSSRAPARSPSTR